MELMLLFLVFGLIYCEPEDAYCCKSGQGVMSEIENRCVDSVNNITSPTKLLCENVTSIPVSTMNFIVTDDGRLIVLTDFSEPHIESDQFCIVNRTLSSDERATIFCDEKEEEVIDEKILGYCMCVSVVFFALILVVYSALPELRDLQGKSFMNCCGSLAIGLLLLSLFKFNVVGTISVCAAQVFLIYFFLLAGFFWTNALSIQFLLSIRRPTISDYGWKQFIWYALYAWGCPMILTIVMAIVNYYPGYHRKPGIGLNTCWFFSKLQQWHYMYSVMTILLLANICIFVYILIFLWRQTFSSSHIKALKYKFLMTVRMIVVMGLPWVFEMISSLSKPHIIWSLIDIFNLSQGFIVFLLLVVFRKRAIKAMYKRGWLNCIAGTVERHLAVGDDEEEVVHHTTDVPLRDDLTN